MLLICYANIDIIVRNESSLSNSKTDDINKQSKAILHSLACVSVQFKGFIFFNTDITHHNQGIVYFSLYWLDFCQWL